MDSEEVKHFGKYIVANPSICNGKLTFVGTRIMIWQVVESYLNGKDIEYIINEWNGKVCYEAVIEALLLYLRWLGKFKFHPMLMDFTAQSFQFVDKKSDSEYEFCFR